MGNSTVKAQKLANEANLQIAQETNQANLDIAAAQNELNYKMFNEQNDWNYQMWKEQNAYNDPSAQMSRYMKAGINPLWAISNGDPGNAQQLTSASAQPAVGATMVAPSVMPEYDPNRIGNIIAAANNVNNSLQGFMKLGLEAMDVDTRQAVGKSQIGVNMAEAGYKASQTAGQAIFNNLNTDTYEVLVGIKQREYDNLVEDLNNKRVNGQLTQALIDNAKETKQQIIAMTDYTHKQGDAIIQQTLQGWRRLAIDQQNANTNAMNAATNDFVAKSNSYYQGENLKFQGQQFQFQVDQSINQFKAQTIDQLIKFYSEKRGYLGRLLGNLDPTDQLTHLGTEPTTEKSIEKAFADIQAVGTVLYERYKENPTSENFKSYTEYVNGLKSLPQAPMPTFEGATTSNTSIQNPLAPWTPWQ